MSQLVGRRIEQVFEFETPNEKDETTTVWRRGVVKEVCNGEQHGWVVPRHRTKCHKAGEAARVLWDAMPENGTEEEETVTELCPKKWNKGVIDGWRFDVVSILLHHDDN